MKQDEKKKIKNYLRGYERAEERIRQIEADIDYINQTLDSMPQIFDGMPRGGNISDRAAQEGQRLWALSLELSEKRCEAIKKRKEIAEKIYERHTLISELLTALGVPRETAMEDACRIEHVISPASFEAVKRYVLQQKQRHEKECREKNGELQAPGENG